MIYHLGVAKRLRESPFGSQITCFAGASGGAIAAAACALLPPALLDKFVEESALRCDGFGGLARALGVQPPLASSSTNEIVSEELVRSTSGSLFIGATECRTGRRVLFANYDSAHELMRCILASCAIPPSAHPFDLLRSRPPTYPEAEGIVVAPHCEWDGVSRSTEESRDQLPSSPHGEAFVDGGLSAAVPLPPAEMQLALVTVAPISGPRGSLGSDHLHVCPADDSLKLPFAAPSLAGLRCYLSVDNLVAARRTLGASPKALRKYYERGQEDAEWLLNANANWPRVN